MKLILTNANIKDADFVFNLKGSKEVRQFSINKKKVNYKNHTNWFKKKIKEKKSKFYIVKERKNISKIGYVRFDYKDFYYRVTIAIIKSKTGKNLSSKILKKAESKLKSNSMLISQVILQNIKSMKLFQRLKYKNIAINKSKNIKLFAKIT